MTEDSVFAGYDKGAGILLTKEKLFQGVFELDSIKEGKETLLKESKPIGLQHNSEGMDFN